MSTFAMLASTVVVALAATPSSEIDAKAKEIDDMQKALEKKVETYNAELKRQHDAKVAGSADQKPKEMPTNKASSTAVDDQEVEVLRNKMKEMFGRLEEIEMNIKKLAKGDKDVKFMTQAERDAATEKAAHEDQHNINNTKALAQYNKAMELLNKGDVKAAEKAFGEVIGVYPKDPYAIKSHVRRGDLYVSEGKYTAAIEDYMMVLDEKNLDVEVYNDASLGEAKALIETHQRARACKILISLNKANMPMHEKQNQRLQKLLLDGNCASKMDKDRRVTVDSEGEPKGNDE